MKFYWFLKEFYELIQIILKEFYELIQIIM